MGKRNGFVFFAAVLFLFVGCSGALNSRSVSGGSNQNLASTYIVCDVASAKLTRIFPTGQVEVGGQVVWTVVLPNSCVGSSVTLTRSNASPLVITSNYTYQTTYSQALTGYVEQVYLNNTVISATAFNIVAPPAPVVTPLACSVSMSPINPTFTVNSSGQTVFPTSTFTVTATPSSSFQVTSVQGFGGALEATEVANQVPSSFSTSAALTFSFHLAGSWQVLFLIKGADNRTAACTASFVVSPQVTTPAPFTAFQAMVDVVLTPENYHVVGGLPGPIGYLQFGGSADCGWGWCYGNQIFYKKLTTIASATDGSMVMYAFAGSTPNAHVVGGTPLPAGLRVIGSVADCIGGWCYGNETFGVAQAPYNSLPAGSKIFTDAWMTAYGQGVNSPACPAGYSAVSYIADYKAGIGLSGNLAVCASWRIK